MSSTPSESPGDKPGARPAADGPAPEPALLERVLQHTTEVWEDDPLDGALRETLLEIFRRHRHHAEAFDAAVVEMVQAVLRAELPDAGGAPEAVAVPVAQALLGDPAARGKLQLLWRKLGEVA